MKSKRSLIHTPSLLNLSLKISDRQKRNQDLRRHFIQPNLTYNATSFNLTYNATSFNLT